MTTAAKLSPKQARALRAIVAFHAAHGFSPTRGDVGRALAPASKTPDHVVRGVIESLILKGFLTAIHASARSMRATPLGLEALVAHEAADEAARLKAAS